MTDVETIRDLVSVRTVDAIETIENADFLETAVVGGWKVVVKKGEFQAGSRAVYFELDSALPLDDERFAFLYPRGVRIIDGKNYHVLKTARLRGVYSQGLLLPWRDFPEISGDNRNVLTADALGIFKYEPPIPAELGGKVEGAFPTQYAMKTDSERVQNLSKAQFASLLAADWYATEKIDGSSVTFILDETGKRRIASRNWEMLSHPSLAQWRLAEELDLWKFMEPGDALQGEIYGEGIQSNPLAIKGQHVRIFGAWRNGQRLPLWKTLLNRAFFVPVLDLKFPESIEEAVMQADGLKSQISSQKQAEGVVWSHLDGVNYPFLAGRSNFKVINNLALLRSNS